jgi:superfamily II DNA or RNA helicase
VGGVIADPEKVASEVKNVFERRFRSVKGEGWRLRHLHEVGLERFVREVLAKGECRKVVQMPTGAGKSVLMALLALATAHLRGCVREGDRRNVMLVFAPLNRIKFQLIEPLVIASGACEGFQPPSFSVYCISSEEKALSEIYNKLLDDYREKIPSGWFSAAAAIGVSPLPSFGAATVTDALKMLQERIEEGGDEYSHIIILCPHALARVAESAVKSKQLTLEVFLQSGSKTAPAKRYVRSSEGETFEFFKSKTLAVFIDEAHVMVDVSDKLGKLLSELTDSTSIALGFTATPLKETCENISKKGCSPELLLYGEPIYSYDLMLRRKWLQQNEEPILISNLKARFHSSEIRVIKAPLMHSPDDLWKNSCRDRVKVYAEVMLRELEGHFGLSAKDLVLNAKTLVLAPNTREADMWKEVLDELLGNELSEYIFVAHSRFTNPHEVIEEFINSRGGILVAVDMVKLGFDDPNLDALVIARPVKSDVVYVQMRGRVLRYPKDKRLKLEKGAFILHLAAEENMESEERVSKVEGGAVSTEQVGAGLGSFGEGVMEFSASVKTDLLGESVVGAPAPQPTELPPPAEAAPIQPAGTAAPTPEAAAAPSLAKQPSVAPQEAPREGIFRRIFKALLSALRRLVPAKR